MQSVVRRVLPKLVLAASFATMLQSAGFAQSTLFSSHDDAVIGMASNLDAAEAVLERASTPSEQLDYALFLHAFRSPTPERDEKIRELLRAMESAIDSKGNYWGAGEIGPRIPYDGTDESLIPLIRAASVSASMTDNAIPCGVLERRPNLITATLPLYGGNGDNFLPASGCFRGRRGVVEDFPQTEIDVFWSVTEQASRPSSLIGTNRYGMFSLRNAMFARMQVDPSYFLARASPLQQFPYQTWSYLSLANHATAEGIRTQFLSSKTALARYYQTKGLSAQDADHAANNALFAISMGSECGGFPPEASLRVLVMDGASLPEIRTFIDSGAWRDQSRIRPIFSCAKYGSVEPLIHVALKNEGALPILQELAAGVNAAEREQLDLVMDVNAPNGFSKTPLMTAAQLNLLNAAVYLLGHGAEVNQHTDALWLANSARTALHYAAASGSFSLIRLLVEHGADIEARDVKGQYALFQTGPEIPVGLRPVDYMEGSGPMPSNPLLSADERTDALNLLSRQSITP